MKNLLAIKSKKIQLANREADNPQAVSHNVAATERQSGLLVSLKKIRGGK